MNVNVICPFGYTEFYFMSDLIELDIILQQYMLDTVLPLCSKAKPWKLYLMSPNYFCEEDDYDCILLNNKWRICPTIVFTDSSLKVLTCCHHGSRDNHIRLYLPRPPCHNLSADKTDQISHCVINPRVAHPTIKNKFTTTHSMACQYGTFSGLDTMNLTTSGDWTNTSILLAEHESNILHNRGNLVHWLLLQVQAGQIQPDLAKNLTEWSKSITPKGSLDKYRQWAISVPFVDNVKLHLAQLFEEGNAGMITAINSINRMIQCGHLWAQTINIVQMEDAAQFGYQFCCIPPLSPPNKAGMMVWSLCSILSSVKEIWHYIDSMTTLLWHNGWEGYLLTFIQTQVFSFQTIQLDPKSPFTKSTSFTKFIDRINKFAHVSLNLDKYDTDPYHLYQFSTELMNNIFSSAHHSSISVNNSVADALAIDKSQYKEKISLLLLDLVCRKILEMMMSVIQIKLYWRMEQVSSYNL